MILSRLKLYAGFALAFILSLLSIKHYRDKSKRLAQDIRIAREIDKIERDIRQQQKKIRAKNERKLQEELDRALEGERDHFEHDPFSRM